MGDFVYRKGVTTEDDIIEHILMLLNTSHAGGVIEVPAFCRLDQGYNYDRVMEPMVRDKMKRHNIATQSWGVGQPETVVMLTPRGAKIYQAGGWKSYLENLLAQKEKDAQALAKKERIDHEKADLEKQKSILEIEKLQYEKENRALTEEINRLNKLNLKLQNTETMVKWVFSAGGFIVTLSSSILLEVWLGAISRAARLLAQVWSSINLN